MVVGLLVCLEPDPDTNSHWGCWGWDVPTAVSAQWDAMHAATHYYVSPPHKLQAGLKNDDVQQVDEVAEVVHEQPEVDVGWRLVGEGPADGDQPAVPVPGQDNEEEPQHIHQVCAQGNTP